MRFLLEDSRIVFTSAILLALLYPSLSQPFQWLITPALIVAMALALRELSFEDFRERRVVGPSVNALLLHYVVHNFVLLALVYLLVGDADYVAGFIVMAAVPPAIAVVPFTYLLKGDVHASMFAEVLAYLVSLAYTPLFIILLLGGVVDVGYLVWLLVILILLPMAASRLMARVKSVVWGYSKIVINVSFAVITYIIIGLNNDAIVSKPMLLMPVVVVIFLRTFVFGTAVYYASRRSGSGRLAVTYALFASYKNNGAAAVIAVALLSVKAALPMAFASIAELLYLIFLQHIASAAKR